MVKNLPANAGDVGLSPGSGRPPGGGNGNPLQYSCLENPTDRGAWGATVHGVTKDVGHDWATKQQIKFITFCLTVYVFMMHSEIACHFMSQSRGQSISGQPHAPEEWRMGFCRHSYGVTCGISMWHWILKWLFSSRTAQQTWLFTQEWLDVLEISL